MLTLYRPLNNSDNDKLTCTKFKYLIKKYCSWIIFALLICSCFASLGVYIKDQNKKCD